jgi:LEA14-like dessication related protein
MKVRPLFLIAFLSVFVLSTLTGCYNQLEIIDVRNFSEVQIGLKGLQSNLDVRIYNPNFFPIKLSETEISLRVRDTDAGDVSLLEGIKLGARDTVLVRFNVATRDGAIAEILKADVLNFLKGADIPFSASGKIIGKSWGITIEVPLEHSQNISLRH